MDEERRYILLPLQGEVCFPDVVFNINITTDYAKSIFEKIEEGSEIFISMQIESSNTENSFNEIGTIASVQKKQKSNEKISLTVQGLQVAQCLKFFKENGIYYVYAQIRKDIYDENALKNIAEEIKQIIRTPSLYEWRHPTGIRLTYEKAQFLMHFAFFLPPEKFINITAFTLNLSIQEKQELLEATVINRALKIKEHLINQLNKVYSQKHILEETTKRIQEKQKEALLLEEYQYLQKELGIGENPDIQKLHKKAEGKEMPPYVKEQFQKGLERLSIFSVSHPEYPVYYAWLECLADFPWNTYSPDTIDISKAKKILDETHSKLEKVKDRIIEYLAVVKLLKEKKDKRITNIICFVGPPGVGKTSLGKAIAMALDRPFTHMSLGGLSDESEIRGHRKTYIGAMPGRIVQKLRKVGVLNPVFVLDEIDKMGKDFRGDPAMALLEVLDPEQNKNFYDNYLECEIDLSNVFFIATANTTETIHPALRDRMEIIEIPGYVLEEKVKIAKEHLLPRVIQNHGLNENNISFASGTIEKIIEGWTNEAGVRQLERALATCARKVALLKTQNENVSVEINPYNLVEFLGPPTPSTTKFIKEFVPGIATGVAWTPTGGEIIYIEALAWKGKEKLIFTGSLGDVMEESIEIAHSLLKFIAPKLNIKKKISDYTIHVHIPSGGIPKDGPSAGVAIFMALLSLFLNKPLSPNIAFSGEITLSGYVLPVGGIKEKTLAVKRASIKKFVLPKANEPDIIALDHNYKKDLEIHFVSHINEVIPFLINKGKSK